MNNKKTLILCLGSMGSGKTYFIKNFLNDQDFVRVSQDELGKKEHIKVFQQLLLQEKNIVIDRMNFDAQQRGRYTVPAKENGYQIVYLWFPTHREICKTRMENREDHPTIGQNDDHYKMLEWYERVFVQPTIDEYDMFFNMLNVFDANKFFNISFLQEVSNE